MGSNIMEKSAAPIIRKIFSSIPKMKPSDLSEILVATYQTTRSYFSEDLTLNTGKQLLLYYCTKLFYVLKIISRRMRNPKIYVKYM